MPLRIPKRSPFSQALGLDVKAGHKYHAKRTEVDGHIFPSQREANRWLELRMLERAGEITELRMQVPFALHAVTDTGQPGYVGSYVADFTFRPKGSKEIVVEDVKGGTATSTAIYRWKKKHLRVQYGVRIQEV